MPILKKKNPKRKRRKSDIPKMEGKVYMPQKKNSVSKRRKGGNIFKKTSNDSAKRKFSRKKNVVKKVTRTLFFVLTPLLLIVLLYVSILFVINSDRSTDIEDQTEYVIGIENVPIFPGSQFIFKNYIDEISVATFIGSGNSAYRLPLNKTVGQAYQYYVETLPNMGWEHVLTVEIGAEEMKHGEYWIKNGTGLRIYSKFNDLWYETVTVEQANNGLRERVKREIERDLLLAGDDLQELLPDFPWVAEIPKEYIISYRTSDYEDLRLVEFRKLGSSESVTVTPVGSIGGPLDDHLREYIDILNQEADTQAWGITNTVLSYTSYGTALQGTISSNGRLDEVAVVSNTYNNVVYVIHSREAESSFFEFVFANIEPQGLNKE